MQCPKCHEPAADDARFCGYCGQPLSPSSHPDATLLRPPRGPVASASASGGAVPPGESAWESASGTGARRLIDRVKSILLAPKTEWRIIEAESTSIAQLYAGYVIPLAAFSAVMSFVRTSLIGVGFARTPAFTGLLYAIVNFGFVLLGMYLVGLIIDALAPTFAGRRDQRQALKTAAYSFTPAALSSVLGLLPYLGPLLQLLACIYGIYLLYLGLPVLTRSPQDKSPGYTAAVVVCGILMAAVLGLLMATVVRMSGYSPYASPYGVHGG